MRSVSRDGLGVGPGHGVSDDEVAGSVLNSLYWDYAVPRDRLNVKVEKGRVILAGEVEWDYQRDCAESDALKARGVTGVTNKILLSHGVQTAPGRVS